MNFATDSSELSNEPTFVEYRGYKLRLVSEHPLWGHVLWNASKVLANLIAEQVIDVRGKTTLELGAGAALPSICAFTHGAARVTATDFPEDVLLDNIRFNASENGAEICVQPLLWGEAVSDSVDFIFLCDLVFNHAEHANLIKSIMSAMHEATEVHCLFSHHLPHRKQKDLRFLALCEQMGLRCEQRAPVFMGRMFPEDDTQFASYPLYDRENVFWWVLRR